jgi:demethylmenaquinone methyltransferase/2-methoxy-6-polyprenyl-1,4-benzoquinol methylase
MYTILLGKGKDVTQKSHKKPDIEQTETTHFGFQQVAEAEKESRVKGVFSKVASRYDVMNDAMSLGVHRLWKDEMLRMLAPKAGAHMLDVAGGTGDIAFRFLKKCEGGTVTVCDINPQMLEEGRKNALNRGITHSIDWQCGNAESLPFEDNSFDYYTIAFGIRNVTHIDKALAEAHRVLKPGGRFLCLEFSKVTQPVLAKCYDLYSFHVIPKLGGLIAGDADSYQYLVESIRKFPNQEHFKQMITDAGFSNTKYRNLTFGTVALHSGWKV